MFPKKIECEVGLRGQVKQSQGKINVKEESRNTKKYLNLDSRTWKNQDMNEL